jgi:site-specific recombinase XerD
MPTFPSTKGRTFPPAPLSAVEVRSLVDACGRRSPTGIRNRALIVVLWRTGLRLSEALDLVPGDVGDGFLAVRRGKGGKARTVGMDPEAFAVLERWLERRKQLGVRSAPLFCTLKGGGLDENYVRRVLRRMATRAGVEKRVHPHGLRHTHANELAEEGVPMPVIQAQLGHSSLATTARYLQRVGSTPAVLRAMGQRAWGESNDPSTCNATCG